MRTTAAETGYGLVESGMCHRKNEVSILLTNAVDVGLGGFFYWAFGHALGRDYLLYFDISKYSF